MIFKSQEEAIAACNARCQEAFEEFIAATTVKGANVDRASRAFKTAQDVFTFGFMRGAEFVTSVVIQQTIKNPNTGSKL
jgi:hypothetical protein